MSFQAKTNSTNDLPELPQVAVAQAEAVASGNLQDEVPSEHGRSTTASHFKDASYIIHNLL